MASAPSLAPSLALSSLLGNGGVCGVRPPSIPLERATAVASAPPFLFRPLPPPPPRMSCQVGGWGGW